MLGEDWDSVLCINFDGFYNVFNLLVMFMVWWCVVGCIVILVLVLGLIGNCGQVNYSVVKVGVIGVIKVLVLELVKCDIIVNCVVFGLIDIDMIEDVFVDEIFKLIFVCCVGKFEEVVVVVVFLMLFDVVYIMCQVILVNGGLV